jgi:hypothetical protein
MSGSATVRVIAHVLFETLHETSVPMILECESLNDGGRGAAREDPSPNAPPSITGIRRVHHHRIE